MSAHPMQQRPQRAGLQPSHQPKRRVWQCARRDDADLCSVDESAADESLDAVLAVTGSTDGLLYVVRGVVC